VRCKDLAAARKVFGRAIGEGPKEKDNVVLTEITADNVVLTDVRTQVFKAYIELELQLGNIDRVRTVYEKMLERYPANCKGWAAFAELE
ncbi:hypothetical protein T484DRAFT_1867911, partial [Baffinella frigidus]